MCGPNPRGGRTKTQTCSSCFGSTRFGNASAFSPSSVVNGENFSQISFLFEMAMLFFYFSSLLRLSAFHFLVFLRSKVYTQRPSSVLWWRSFPDLLRSRVYTQTPSSSPSVLHWVLLAYLLIASNALPFFIFWPFPLICTGAIGLPWLLLHVFGNLFAVQFAFL